MEETLRRSLTGDEDVDTVGTAAQGSTKGCGAASDTTKLKKVGVVIDTGANIRGAVFVP